METITNTPNADILRDIRGMVQKPGRSLKGWQGAIRESFSKCGPLNPKLIGCAFLAAGLPRQSDRNIYFKIRGESDWRTEEVLVIIKESIKAGGSPILDMVMADGFMLVPASAAAQPLDTATSEAIAEIVEERRWARLKNFVTAKLHLLRAEEYATSMVAS